MAYSSTPIAGSELAALSLDVPILVGTHLMRDEFDPDTTGNIWTSAGFTTSPDKTESGYPTRLAWDGFAHSGLYTRPDLSNTEWFYMMALGSSTFDTVCVWGENLDEADSIQLQIADSSDFSSNLSTVMSVSGATRVTGILGNRYSGVDYARLYITKSGGGILPRLNELWIGHRRQLLGHVSLPMDNRHGMSVVRAPPTSNSVSPPRTLRRGGAIRTANLSLSGSTEFGVVSDWYTDTRHGVRSFLWIETPSSDPQTHLMTIDGQRAELRARMLGPYRRDLSIRMRESDPFNARLY